jgi:anaerobic magnesium-protoporphyrin IX monomethyl ester cyclase
MIDALLIYPQSTTSRHRPEIEDDPGRSMPLGLLSVAAAVEGEGYRTAVLDARLYTSSGALDALKARLGEGVRWVGLSVMTCQVPHALELTCAVKTYCKDVSVIWGGAHPTLFPEQTVQHPAIDWVAVGEAEVTFPKLLAGTPACTEEMAGLATRRTGEVLLGPPAPALDPGQFPVPAYHLVDLETYLSRRLPAGGAARGIDVLTSRGCPYRCAFCPNTFLLGRRWRPLSPDAVTELLARVTRVPGLETVWFVDDYFFGDVERATGIATWIGSNLGGLGWEANIRPDLLKDGRVDDRLLAELRSTGCHSLRMGAESGSGKVLEILRKDIVVEDIVRGVRMCAQAGIVPVCFFMMGIPGETTKDLVDTLALMANLARGYPSVVPCGPGLFRPYPGGDLYETCVGLGLRQPSTVDEWAHYPFSQGYLDPCDLPWVEDPSLARDVPFYLFYIQERMKLTTYSAPWLRSAMATLSNWRALHRRWGFRWEASLARTLRRLRGASKT